MSKIDELLAVLDMTKAEQYGWAVDKYPEYLAKYPQKSLADLAFRLRDEACKISCEKYHESLESVYNYHGIQKQCQSFYGWLMYRIEPIDWIIAALIAKEQ